MIRKVLGAAAFGLVFAVAACGPSGGGEPAAEAPAAEAPAVEAAPAEAPAETAAAEPAAQLVSLEIEGHPTGDPAKGQRIFAQCQTCHSIAAGENRIGPSLNGIIGRPAGSVEGFAYSAANKGSGLTWTEQQLWTYLENPQRTIRGTIMAFAGIKDPQQRADVIAYLKENAK